MKKAILSTVLFTLITSTSFAKIEIPALAQALQTGDQKILTQYLQEGGDPNATLMQGQTLTFAAVATMNMPALKELISSGADVNDGGKMMGKKNMSPLYLATTLGNLDAMKVLLDAGADPNTSYMGTSVRRFASLSGHSDALALLNEAILSNTKEDSSSPSLNINSKTILSRLSDADIQKAKADAVNGKRLSYDLFEKGRSFLDGIMNPNKMPVRLALFTPYSLYRHGFYEESQTFIPFSDAAKKDILSDKNKVYILPYSIVDGVLYPTVIRHLVIRKNGVVYQPEPLTNAYMQSYGHTFAYGFSIDLFDGKPMEIIAIDAQNDKQLVMPIDKSFYQKRNWY